VCEVKDHELVIIGAGVAGLTAGVYAARYGLDLVVLSEAGPGGQTATAATIENFPGFPDGISGPELVVRLTQQAQKFDVRMEIAKVEQVQFTDDGRWNLLAGGVTYRTTAILVAVGASPRRLKIPGERDLFGKGVSYCATCDGFFYRGKTVAVVGGGNTAIEEAMYLADVVEKVYVIHRRDELRAEPILAKRAFAVENIEFIWDTIPLSINGTTEVDSVTLQNKKTEEQTVLTIDGLFVAVGYEPNTGFLADVVDLEDGFIVANCNMETSQPGIFAAGDVRNTPLRQVVTAVGDAAIAACKAYHYVAERR